MSVTTGASLRVGGGFLRGGVGVVYAHWTAGDFGIGLFNALAELLGANGCLFSLLDFLLLLPLAPESSTLLVVCRRVAVARAGRWVP